MSYQIKKAFSEIDFFRMNLENNLERFWNTPARAALLSVQREFANDRTLAGFIEKASKPGREALAAELAIRAITKIDHYNKQIMNAIRGPVGRVPATMGWSFSDLWGGDESSDRELGIELLRTYYEAARIHPGMVHSSFDAFLSSSESIVPQYADLIGELVKSNKYSTSVSEAKNRLIDLATKSKGTAALQQIVQAAGGSGDTVNWTGIIPDLSKDVATEVMTEAGEFLQNTGTGVMSTLNLVRYLPWIVGGAAIIYLVIVASKHGAGFSRATERLATDTGEAIKTLASRKKRK